MALAEGPVTSTDLPRGSHASIPGFICYAFAGTHHAHVPICAFRFCALSSYDVPCVLWNGTSLLQNLTGLIALCKLTYPLVDRSMLSDRCASVLE